MDPSHIQLARAYASYRSGNLPDAERRFRHVLQQRPDQPEALHMLGLIAHRKGQPREAASVLGAAVRSDPNNAELRYHLAEVLRALGDHHAAIEEGQRAVRLAPDSAPGHNNLGLALQSAGRLDEAEASFRRAAQCDPSYAKAAFNLGNVLRQKGELVEAAAALSEALSLTPRYPQALNALGAVLSEQGRFEEASAHFHRALRIAPGYIKPLLNLGNLFAKLDRFTEAHECFDRALKLDRHYFEAWLAKASLFHRGNRIREQIESLRQALRLRREDPRAHFQLGTAHFAQFRFDAAAKCFRRVLELELDNPEARANLAQCHGELCRWQERTEEFEGVRELVAARVREGKPSPVTPHGAIFFPFDPEEHLEIAQSVAEHYADRVLVARKRARFGEPAPPAPRLRVGYLSSDFRDNALAHLTRRLYGLHDRARFEIYAYSIGPDDGSEYRRGIAADCDGFVDLARASGEEAAQSIHADGIHILVDLVGFAGGARPEIPALRPAPIQVIYLYPGTMGGVFHDYFLGDSVITPSSAREFFGERLAILPHCFQVNDHLRAEPDRAFSRAEVGLPEEEFIFCCFNTHAKLEPKVFDVWMRILGQVPGSVLWLLEMSRTAKENLRQEAASRGIPPDRLVFAPHRPNSEHLARHRLADLFLDTFICNAHTTASDALWSGVPIVTCPGRTVASRVSASLVHGMGLSELVTKDPESYERLAVSLANDRAKVAALKEDLRSRRATYPLFDTPRFVRNLERTYIAMWQRHQAGQEPDTIIVGED